VGVLCGLAALVFVELHRGVRTAFAWLHWRTGLWPPLAPLLGGVLVAALVLVAPTDFLGLSLPVMDRALAARACPCWAFCGRRCWWR